MVTVKHLVPTHSCFDDVGVFFDHIDSDELREHADEYVIVHALVSAAGHKFAHAWVEYGGLIWQAGIAHGDGFVPFLMFYAVAVDADRGFVVEKTWRYSLQAALDESKRTNSSGPWIAELRKLTDAASAATARGESLIVGPSSNAPVLSAFVVDHAHGASRNEIVGGDPDGGR